MALQVTAGAHGAAAGLRSPSPGWSEANDTLQEAWDGTNPHHAPDDARMHDGGLRSPRPAPDGTDSSRKRSRHVAKMLVRSASGHPPTKTRHPEGHPRPFVARCT